MVAAVYFLLAALASYLDSMQQVLAVVLVLISMKIFLEAAGFEVPLWLFLGVLVGWRVLSIAVQLWTSKKRTAPPPKPTVDEDAEELEPANLGFFVLVMYCTRPEGEIGGDVGRSQRPLQTRASNFYSRFLFADYRTSHTLLNATNATHRPLPGRRGSTRRGRA